MVYASVVAIVVARLRWCTGYDGYDGASMRGRRWWWTGASSMLFKLRSTLSCCATE